MKLLRSIIGLLSDLGGAFIFIIGVMGGISTIYNLISEKHLAKFGPLVVLLIILLLIPAVLFVKRFLHNSISHFSNVQEENKVDLNAKSFEKNRLSGVIKLPKTKELFLLRDLSIKKAKEWASDAIEEDIAVSIKYREGNPSYRCQTTFYSDWKSQELTIFLPKVSYYKYETDRPLRGLHDPFFMKFPDWEKVVKKAYEQISDKIGNSFEIWMFSHAKDFDFQIQCKEGDSTRRYEFSFDGELLSSKDKKVKVA